VPVPCFRRFGYQVSAVGQRSLKLMAKVFSAGFRRIVHLVLSVPVGPRDRVTRQRHFKAARSAGKRPRAFTARRQRA